MIFKYHFKRPNPTPLLSSGLFDEDSFYPAFLNDLSKCKFEVVIESPFITRKRMNALYPSFRRLTKRGVRVVINTRDPKEHDWRMAEEAATAISLLQHLGIKVLYTENHHRKLAIIDRQLLYEGSLNILSQYASCEIMRKIESQELAISMLGFLNIQRHF